MRFNINNRLLSLMAALIFVGATALGASAFSDDSVSMIPGSFSKLATNAKPAVVNISTVKMPKNGGRVFRHFFGNPYGDQDPLEKFFGPFFNQPGQNRDYKQQSLGSGFIISNDGYIVTNNHVVADADQIKVKLFDEKEYEAKIVGTDANTDLALIKIDATGLTPLEMGDSGALEVGSWVVAIGSPFGLEQTVTAGIVSAKGRIIGSGPYDDFIQTDASINPGNSGGPLLNLKGQVVGINTAIIASGQGIGFAIPSSMASGIISQLKDSGEVTRGWMGVAIQDITPELADYYHLSEKDAVLVAKVYADDPADKAGIKAGDIITHIEGNKVKSSRELSSAIAGYSVGKKVEVTFVREGKTKTTTVTLAKRNDAGINGQVVESGTDHFGLGLEAVDQNNARQFGLPQNSQGLVVTEIQPDGKAAGTGIKEGDLLVEINHRPVETLSDYQSVLDSIKSGEVVQLLFRRGNTSFIAIRLTK
ncbi:MAG: Do family serine endopeptidase [Pseudomonadota bacterium]